MTLFDCPPHPRANFLWRLRCRDKAAADKGFREAFMQACMDDVLFFFNACIAENVLVVTDHGPVPIQDVKLHHRVWDGGEWVSHHGVLFKGRRKTISAYESRMTPDHKVWTDHGWQVASEGHERAGVRLPDGYSSRWNLPGHETGSVALPVRMRQRDHGVRQLPAARADEKLRMPQSCEEKAREVVHLPAQHLAGNAAALQQPEQFGLSQLWRPRDSSLRALAFIRALHGGHGGAPVRGALYRSHRQRRRLRTRELSVGHAVTAGAQYADHSLQNITGDAVDLGDSRENRHDMAGDSLPHQEGSDGGRVACASSEAVQPVFDMLNCGTRQAFTILDDHGRPLLVHNCLWVYEPRSKIKTKPFCVWPHQVPVILKMDATIDEAMDNERPISLTVPKSRAQGATYIYLGVFIRRALRDPGFAAGLVTRNEELVDSRTDADAVMYKLAWMLDRLPKWMLPEGYQRNSTEHTIAMPNGSVFSGYAATGDVARGGRKTAFAFDEPGSEEFVQGNKDYKIMSSVGSVSNCTLLVSTFGLDSGVFYESAMDPDNRRIVKLDWKDNPVHSKNAYVIKDGEATAIRAEDAAAVKKYIADHGRELKSIERRGHKMDGKVRSPWYDAHCLLPGGTPRFIARELDMDPRGAVGKLFDSNLLDTVRTRDCRAPVWQGKPVFDGETLKLTGLLSRADGPLKLWFKPGVDNSAPLGPFSVGCDIAMGSDGAYSSNSVASIIDDRTGEQVGEYTIMGMQSIIFARNVIGLCMWLRNARLGWEDSGVSGPFAKEVMETQCYGNVYYREVAEIGSRRKSRKAGWRNGKDEDKADLFEKMALAMERGAFKVRSEDLIRECGEYEWEKGKIIHRPTKNIDQSEKAHGDRCIAAGVAWLVYSEDLRTDRIDTGDETGKIPEYGSYLWREQQERPRLNADSPEFGIRDVMLT